MHICQQKICMYVYMYIHVHMHVHIYIYIYVHIFINTQMCIYMYIYICAYDARTPLGFCTWMTSVCFMIVVRYSSTVQVTCSSSELTAS